VLFCSTTNLLGCCIQCQAQIREFISCQNRALALSQAPNPPSHRHGRVYRASPSQVSADHQAKFGHHSLNFVLTFSQHPPRLWTMTNIITLKAQCHCGHASYSYELPKSDFPLKSAICHCSSCRHVSGQIFTTHVVIPVEERPDVSRLTSYASSQGVTRHFCPKCGATMINFEKEEWEIATGVLSVEGKPEVGALDDLLDRVQLWVSDTIDGGGSVWMLEDWDGKRYLYNRGSEAVTDEMLQDMATKADRSTSKSAGDVLQANCHCGSIKITVEKPEGGGKYGAGIDACISCRKVSGFEITSWATLDPTKLSINGTDLDLDTVKLSHYKTSRDVHRYFCSKCGATIFYLKDGKVKNPGIDLAAGLIDSQSGVRAEDWLDWTKYDELVAYKEDASDKNFVQGLVDGVRKSRQDHVKD
jgi:hypothetical protein